ncbi:MAG: hypothetical protein LBL58_13510 [Tannerellaceae bacterium]|jgi:hypothetical protein|nr:hypothetical protein [Tannerellaceae bacterium]
MLHQGSKILLIISFLFSILSCSKYKKYDYKEVASIRDRTMTMSLHVIGQTEYWNIYDQANDSIMNWQQHQLGLWKYYGDGINYQLDSIFCINKTGDKIFFSILRQNLDENAAESIWYFYGVKIQNQWYFFDGSALVLPREYYQKDIHTPLSFETIKQIATDHIYRGYLKKGKKGQWEINESFFSRFYERDAYNYPFTTQEAWEESWLRLNRAKWEKRDATELE